ncbi:MAG: hypothetical protein KGJ41_14240 [Rhodospirillales bacterium]|nr:hypothetical protein [Rhodospirillales bacterium]MDE2200172.1 hypothetical protein [Rhodospirillales bacterium]
MSEDRKAEPEWLVAAGAIAALSGISPPAAGAAAITLGLHHLYKWWQQEAQDDQGPTRPESRNLHADTLRGVRPNPLATPDAREPAWRIRRSLDRK